MQVWMPELSQREPQPSPALLPELPLFSQQVPELLQVLLPEPELPLFSQSEPEPLQVSLPKRKRTVLLPQQQEQLQFWTLPELPQFPSLLPGSVQSWLPAPQSQSWEPLIQVSSRLKLPLSFHCPKPEPSWEQLSPPSLVSVPFAVHRRSEDSSSSLV